MDLKTTYDRIAEDWSKDHGADTWWIEGTNTFCSFLKPGASILDLGCGGGFKTGYLADKGFAVTGVDFSEKMIEAARKKYPALDFDVVDAYDLDVYEKNFDAVFAQAVILHIPKARVREVLEKMKGRLNEDGLIYIAVKEIHVGQDEELIKKENDYGYDYERFFSFFTLEELEQHFKDLNMEVVWKDVASSGRANWIQIIARKRYT